jgi:hypothetical protein
VFKLCGGDGERQYILGDQFDLYGKGESSDNNFINVEYEIFNPFSWKMD